MASGWARDGAVQEQIDASIDDAVAQARRRLPQGDGALCCDACEQPIPEGRRRALPGVRLCVACQSAQDARSSGGSPLYNRRGSKDSQLR